MRTGALALASLLLSGCGARTALTDDAARDAEPRPDSGSDAGLDAGWDAGPPPCVPEPRRACAAPVVVDAWYAQDFVGEPTVVGEVEALASGIVLVAGYFGVLRHTGLGTGWEPIDAPELLGSSFLSLRRGDGDELWATAFGEVVYTPDAGQSWQPAPDLGGISHLHRLLDGSTWAAGDQRIGLVEPPLGAPMWLPDIELLSSDDPPGLWEDNSVYGLAHAGRWLIAAERTGRMARAIDPAGPWEAIEQRTGDPELLELGDGRVLLFGSDGAFRITCDDGATWPTLGTAQGFWSGAVGSTQVARASDGTLVVAVLDGLRRSCDLGQTWETLTLPTEDPIAYDVSAAPDGSVWAAGYDFVYRVSW